MLLVGFGGLGSAWLVTSASDTDPVLALAHDVQQGEVLTRGDLVVVRLTPSPELSMVAAGDIDAVVGQRAAASMSAGSLLTRAATTQALVPGEGQSVVGVSLTPAQMPAEPLTAGDPVRIVSTPLVQADPPSDTPDVVTAEVVSVSEPDAAGARTVDVVVPGLQAAELAAKAATGRVALVLDSRSA
ncbi:SAF domain-containing protein [Quadrisphaera sp. KR29]|uniref:SAF domain-containing protein n=1 Tax=Quadrisphaera sp. KR29 TaxID=3461391 RepID=UPI004044F41B